MANQQNLSRRASMRQQQEMEERRKRNTRILGIGGGILVLAIVVIIAVVAIPPLLNSNQVEVTEAQKTPPNATAEYGIMQDGKMPNDEVPNLIIYADFMCPHCAQYEAAFGPVYGELVDEDKITVEHRTAFFMDRGTPGSSQRAAVAAATADSVGKYKEYASVLFANQSGRYPEKDLRETFAEQAGITGDDLEQFQESLRTREYLDFVVASDEAFANSDITGTPTFVVNDRRLNFVDPDSGEVYIEPTAESLMAAIEKAANGEDDPSNGPIG